jgi:protoporphyrinogen/coproporphyrinogen III oxidase
LADRSTAVIGGGMAGCAAARELVRAGRRVTLFEAADGLGGRARSWHRPEIDPDTGINLWFTSLHRTLLERIREYGLEGEMVTMQNHMIVVRDGRAAPLASDSTRTLLTFPHVSAAERLRFLLVTLRETLRRGRLDLFDVDKLAAYDDGRSAADWARSRLTERVLDNLIRPELESFWLWRCDEVSAAHVMAMQAGVIGLRFYVLGPGMEAVADRMADGADVRLEATVTGIEAAGGELRVSWTGEEGGQREAFDEVVLAVHGPAAAELAAPLAPEPVDPELVRFARTQRYEPALSISYLIDRGLMPSGAHIVPAGPEPPPVRTIITVPKEEVTAGGRRERELVFVYIGRRETAELLDAPDERRYEETRRLAARFWPGFPADAEPFHIAERRIGLAMPEPGRYRRASELGRRQRGPVVFAGDFLSSPTAESAMRTGVRAARALLAAGEGAASGPRRLQVAS